MTRTSNERINPPEDKVEDPTSEAREDLKERIRKDLEWIRGEILQDNNVDQRFKDALERGSR